MKNFRGDPILTQSAVSPKLNFQALPMILFYSTNWDVFEKKEPKKHGKRINPSVDMFSQQLKYPQIDISKFQQITRITVEIIIGYQYTRYLRFIKKLSEFRRFLSTRRINKLGLNWAKLRSNWNWALLLSLLHLLNLTGNSWVSHR